MDIFLDRLINEQEAASLLGTSPAHLRRSRSTGELWRGIQTPAFVKLGPRSIRYKLSMLMEFIQQHPTVTSTANCRATSTSRKAVYGEADAFSQVIQPWTEDA
jgi:predicted DNA-binding transcriptional regulator AlpA